MSSLFNSDGSFPLQFAIIFLVIFVILAAGAYAFRRITGRGMSLSSKAAQRGRQPRLGIIDIYELDRQRQLILLRRDNVEHLLLVGGPNDVVVERNIVRGAAARAPFDEAARLDPEPDPAEEIATPKAPGATIAPPVFAGQSFAGQSFAGQDFSGQSFAGPEIAAPLPQAPPFEAARPQRPTPSAPAPVAARPADHQAEENALFEAIAPAPREPITARGPRRAPPPLANLRPEPSAEPARPAPAPEPIVIPKPPEPPRAEPPRVEPPAAPPPPAFPSALPVSNPAPRAIDAAILADMARQLEETLQRPAAEAPAASHARPEQPPAAPPAPVAPPAPREPEPERQEAPAARPVDPMAAAMAASPPEPPADDLFVEASPPAPQPTFMAAPPAPPPPEPASPPAEPAPAGKPDLKPATQNPFSVEEIEAEFARLLGRPLDRKS